MACGNIFLKIKIHMFYLLQCFAYTTFCGPIAQTQERENQSFKSCKSFKSSPDCPTHLPQQLHLRASSPRDLRSPPLPSPCVQPADGQCHYTINTHSEISLFVTLDILNTLRGNVNLGGGLTNDVTASQRGWKDTICWQNLSLGKRSCKYKIPGSLRTVVPV